MSRTRTDLVRHVLHGPTMGTRWSAIVVGPPHVDPTPLKVALGAAVAEVDEQMSTWRPESDLMRLNRAAPGSWVEVPRHLMRVLEAGLVIGRASGGAFDIGVGDAVAAWGFSAAAADEAGIRAARLAQRRPAHDTLELEPSNGRARKHGSLSLDLCGIAKGYGVDRLAETVQDAGIEHALLSIDGEVRALGTRPDGQPWAVAIERPEPGRRSAHSVLALTDAAVATSGDYRRWVEVEGRRLTHTMDPRCGLPIAASPASVTVLATRCMAADGWATAMMVLGRDAGAALARRLDLSVLFIERRGETMWTTPVGPVIEADARPLSHGA